MVEYVGKGRNPEEAKENLFKNASSAGVSNLEGTVSYEVSILGERDKMVSGKVNEDYVLAFASALSAAKLNPDNFDSAKNPYEVIAWANYQVPEGESYRTAAEARNPSGSAPKSYSGKGLTDLF